MPKYRSFMQQKPQGGKLNTPKLPPGKSDNSPDQSYAMTLIEQAKAREKAMRGAKPNMPKPQLGEGKMSIEDMRRQNEKALEESKRYREEAMRGRQNPGKKPPRGAKPNMPNDGLKKAIMPPNGGRINRTMPVRNDQGNVKLRPLDETAKKAAQFSKLMKNN